MFWLYLKERISWILFILFLQAFTLLVAFLDPTIPVESLLYINFLALIIIAIFIVIRWQRETRFFTSLQDRDPSLDDTNIDQALSPFEEIISETLQMQTYQLKQQEAINRQLVENEKDELLNWIHEVKTPLTAMNLMIDRIDDESTKKQLHHEWLRIHLLLDQQLHQKRIPFMENDLFMEELSFKSIIFNEIRTLQLWCMEKGIGFDVDLDVETVISDGKWLTFIVRQILTNAVKYSDQSDIIICTMCEKQTKLIIMDHGQGIHSKDLPRIFDKGFTSTTRHQNNQATGMGLYLAKKAAENLHIQIKVDSTYGEGTTFTLIFPNQNEFQQITGM